MERGYEKVGLEVEPKVIEFTDFLIGEEISYQKITFYNRGNKTIKLKILKPYSWVFQVEDDGTQIFLSPGLSTTRKVTYTYAHDFSHESNLPFVIDNKYYFDIPIKVKVRQSLLSVSPLRLNFGIIDLGCRFVAQYLVLTNSGSCAGKFSIDFGTNKLDLLATPKQGQVPPYGMQTVKIEMAGFIAGELLDEFWVKGEPPTRIEVEVHVLFPYFQAMHPNTTGDFTLINFKPTFFGTERYETFIVQNVSSFPSCFVVLAEMNNQLFTLSKAVKQVFVYSNFSIHPVEGTLGPFEGHIFTIKFHPHSDSSKTKGWKHSNVDELEFLCFLRILRVDVIEWQDDGGRDPFSTGAGRTSFTAASSMSDPNHDLDMLRICLHGDGVKPLLTAVPDYLCFGGLEVGMECKKVIRLTNESCSLPLGYRYRKTVGLYVYPRSQFIDPKKSLEITVSFRATSLTYDKNHLTFEVIAYQNLMDKKNLKTIAEVHIGFSVKIKTSVKIPQPKFNLGITPSIAHESGVHTELIKYKDIHSKAPKSLLVPKDGTDKRPWLHGIDFVAYPNDRPRSFRVKKHDPKVRAIFTGTRRYIPPVDPESTYTRKEKELMNRRNEQLRTFYGKKAERIRQVYLAHEKVAFGKRTYSDERLEKLIRPKKDDMWVESFRDIIRKKPMTEMVALNEICPLTPTHLYNIRVMPKTLDFGKIPPNVDCVKIIRIDNFNNFSVTIKLFLQKDKMKEEVFVVPARSRHEKEVTLNLESYGKFYSNVSYVVNNSHSFDLKLSAEVVQRTLSVTPSELTINAVKVPFEDIFQVKWGVIKIYNPLYVPTKYSWKVPPAIPFLLEPMCGEVPGNRCINCVVYSNLRNRTVLASSVHLIVNEGHQIPIRISLVEDKSHNVSVMLSKRILPPISLNLSFCETVLFFNAGFKDVIYSIVTPEPIDGVTMRPIVGVMPARACIGMAMFFKMTSIAAFDFHLLVEIQGTDIVESKFIGHVVFPKVEFKPKMLILRSTPCFSRDCYNIQIENQSPAVVQIQFPMDNYPQMTLSLSKNDKLPGLDDDGLTLLPKDNKDLFLHFKPQDLATYEFYLPFILNRIIGPPVINNDDTQKPETYITINRENNKLKKFFDLECPSKVSSIHVDCSVAKGYLEFSKRQFTFNLLERKEIEKKSITLKNITKDKINLFLDAAILAPTPFRVVKGPSDRNQMACLVPGDSITIEMSFEPLFPNVFECDLPLFVKEHSESAAYTNIHVKGTLPKSVLYCPTYLIHFLPVPTDCYIERYVEVIATHQYRDTKLNCFMRRISGEYQGEDVFEYIYPKGNKIPKNHEPFTVPVIIRFKSRRNISVRGTIVLSDEQDGNCNIQFSACADNSVVTNHIYLYLKLSAKEEVDPSVSSTETIEKRPLVRIERIPNSTMNQEFVEEVLEYPRFPKKTSFSRFAGYMRRALRTTEQWLFEQGFSGSYRMIIGNHIAFSKAFVNATHARSKSSYHDTVRSIIDLLSNFVGRDLLLQYQLSTTIPEDDIGRISYCLSVYKQILLFIKVQGGHASHIFPAYLLAYEDYVFYYNEVKIRFMDKSRKGGFHYQDIFDVTYERGSTQIFLHEEEFERYNLQSWLDLILQIHKTVVQANLPYRLDLKVIDETSLKENRAYSLTSENEENVTIESMPHLKKLTLERTDKVLLTWLNVVYNSMKNRIEGAEPKWPEKNITNLHTHLQDGVVLCAVTLFYCPYIEELYFQDFYFNPSDSTQNHHNGVILATAWNAIRLGLTVVPADFYNSNPIAMMILVCHLYSVMGTYIPQAVIQFLSCLSQSVTRKISVINPNSTPIGYAIKILGDSNGSFSIEKLRPVLVLAGKSSTTILVNFTARTITPVKAILVLSGTCLPSGYANNMVFTLIGEPYKLVVTSDYAISTPVYKPTFINANVISPYKVEGEYEMWYSEEEPRPGRLVMAKWSSIRQQKLPRILYIGCNRLIIPPATCMHPAVLPLTAACYSLTLSTFWIIMRNQDIGDFIIRVIIKPRIDKPFLILPVRLPAGICTGFANAHCSFNCPRSFFIYIPCRNARLWATVKAMFSLALEKKEHSFWEHHLETRIGLDLVKWMLGDQKVSVAQEIGYVFSSKIKYNVTSLSKDLEIEPTVTINDVHSPGFVQLMAHVCCQVEQDTVTNIMLESDCRKEIRYYQIRFTEVSGTAIEATSLPCRKCMPPSIPKQTSKSKESRFLILKPK
ncbi:cilia and flagella-associated protein 47 isoform X3 [Halyomorpha halys]|uniref:cilia and flagella-associated protein 47 isoform X3 n=1 Tax=Halyomorpha halys TaxID=286706 RepID=UPI0006D50BC9|nr:uncharacterized protein LOC106684603 isoform X3 [Halyomorpha halys]